VEVFLLGMIPSEEASYILSHAYVPEHIVDLMVLLSEGEPFLSKDYLSYRKDNWLIFIGYPLYRDTSPEPVETILKSLIEKFKPQYVWFIGKEVPESVGLPPGERNTDQYYKVDLPSFKMKNDLLRMVERARRALTVERTSGMTGEHDQLIREFFKRESPNDWIRGLFKSLPAYANRCKTATVLNARDQKGNLSAFYVLELGAAAFATYIAGCHSKKHYVAQASDLLFFEMVEVAKEKGKGMINLGLGVNEGIRRFKEKWGGVPFLRYEFCEYTTGFTHTTSLIKALEGKL
jgi:hypothetical protein